MAAMGWVKVLALGFSGQLGDGTGRHTDIAVRVRGELENQACVYRHGTDMCAGMYIAMCIDTCTV